jgi:uncharacterized protein YecE (DUF72 family)
LEWNLLSWGLSSKNMLKYFSEHFKTTEINYSFYHLPKPQFMRIGTAKPLKALFLR